MAREGQGYPCCQHDMMMMMMIYIYTSLRKKQTGHIRIINLFPSCYAFFEKSKNTKKINGTSSLPGKFKCSLLNSFLVLMELLPTPV